MPESRLILPGDPGFLSPENVNKLHSLDDVDTSATAHHHTLGSGPLQASPGTHKHDALSDVKTFTPVWGGMADPPAAHAGTWGRYKYLAPKLIWVQFRLIAGSAGNASSWRWTIDNMPAAPYKGSSNTNCFLGPFTLNIGGDTEGNASLFHQADNAYFPWSHASNNYYTAVISSGWELHFNAIYLTL